MRCAVKRCGSSSPWDHRIAKRMGPGSRLATGRGRGLVGGIESRGRTNGLALLGLRCGLRFVEYDRCAGKFDHVAGLQRTLGVAVVVDRHRLGADDRVGAAFLVVDDRGVAPGQNLEICRAPSAVRAKKGQQPRREQLRAYTDSSSAPVEYEQKKLVA